MNIKKLNEELKKVLNENFLSDEQIENQYKNFKCTNIEIDKSTVNDDWYNVTLELEFPNADHPDFDDYVIENLYYNREDDNWGFDGWYPDEVRNEIKKLVLGEISKKYPVKDEPFERISAIGKFGDFALVKSKTDGRYSIYKLDSQSENGLEPTPIESRTYSDEDEAVKRAVELGI